VNEFLKRVTEKIVSRWSAEGEKYKHIFSTDLFQIKGYFDYKYKPLKKKSRKTGFRRQQQTRVHRVLSLQQTLG